MSPRAPSKKKAAKKAASRTKASSPAPAASKDKDWRPPVDQRSPMIVRKDNYVVMVAPNSQEAQYMAGKLATKMQKHGFGGGEVRDENGVVTTLF